VVYGLYQESSQSEEEVSKRLGHDGADMKESALYSHIGWIEVIRLYDWEKPYPLHNHVSVYTIGLIIKGKMSLTLDSRENQIREGEAFFVPPYIPHALYPIGAIDMISLCFSKHPADADRARLKHSMIFEVKNLCRKGLFQPKDESALSDVLKSSALSAIIASERDETSFIASVRNFLERTPEAQIKGRQLAERFAVCEDHMIREFKKKLGLTPHYFQIQNRIRKAQVLLEQGVPISEAALAVGFYDQSHFVKYFQRFLGMPPRDYVKACKTPLG
jgi:AraC-like DNA-binding protein